MPHPSEPLRNTRHERFVQSLAQGMSQTAAYVAAGYKQSASATADAARLLTFANVQARLAHVQAMAAKSSAITLESVVRELDEANEIAKRNGQATALVSAAALKAKLAGLLRDKVQVSTDNDEDDLDKPIELTAARIAYERRCLKLTGSELDDFTNFLRETYLGWLEGVDAYLAALAARPVNEAPNPAEIERRRLGFAPSNGQRR